MSILDRYKIDLRELHNGAANYLFELNDSFFEVIEGTLIQSGNVNVDLTVRELVGAYEFAFHIQGVVQVMCDRCLDNMNVPISVEDTLTVKIGDEYEDDGEVVIVPEHEPELNVAWHIYEMLVLDIPLTHVHEDGQCNEKMMGALNKLLVQAQEEVQEDNEESSGTRPVDPRWNDLKKILDNN